MVTHREKDVMLSIDDQEICRQRRQRLAALVAEDPSQKQHDPAQPDEIVDPDLFLVAKRGDVDKFISALEDHCAKERVSLPIVLGLRSPSMNTLLHAAAESDDTVKAVIDFVPEHLISCKNSRGETPLHIAARAGKTHAVELLLPKENPRDADCNGNSALHEAVRNRHHAVIRQLVRKDPRMLYCQNKESKSPWCLAVETGDLEVVKLLLGEPSDGEDQTRSESGSDSGISTVHVKDNRRSESESNFGMSPVHVAIIYRRMGKSYCRALRMSPVHATVSFGMSLFRFLHFWFPSDFWSSGIMLDCGSVVYFLLQEINSPLKNYKLVFSPYDYD